MEINSKVKCVYLLDELLEINEFGLYSQSIIEMIIREITKKSYRETAKTISEDTENIISHTAVRNIILKLGKKIKEIEEEKIKLCEEGKIEGSKEVEYVFCEHDGIYVKKQKSKKHKGKKKFKVKHFKNKSRKRKKNGIELKIAVIYEGKEARYLNDYKLRNKIVVGTSQKAKDIFSLIYNYKVELESDYKAVELEKVKELEIYLKNNEKGLLRYQYKLGYKEDLPSLGSEESHMYCVCINRIKKNRTSWSIEGSESLLKVIINKMNGTVKEVITKKAEEKIKEELAQKIPEPTIVKKQKENKITYAGRYEIASNFTGSTKNYIIDLLKDKKCSELMLIN